MKNKSFLVVVMIVLLFALPRAEATVIFNDGQPYNINYEINDNVWVGYDAPGIQTTVNWLDGASIPYPNIMEVFEDSRLNIYGGQIGSYLYAYDRSQINIIDGSMEDNLVVHDSSQVVISGGSISWELSALGTSHVTISGGSIGDYLVTGDNSQVVVSGGSIGDCLQAYNQ